ncbi:hypothetical protein HOY80DRAFT_959872 [Tuber brumale]|nr:hypothetical protein HOY80DRAFT_959872 [Tuber brumale]
MPCCRWLRSKIALLGCLWFHTRGMGVPYHNSTSRKFIIIVVVVITRVQYSAVQRRSLRVEFNHHFSLWKMLVC